MRSFIKWLISKLPFSIAYEIFYQSGRRLGVTAYQASGQQGAFFGPLADQAAIKPYLRDRSWSQNIVGGLEGFFAGKPAGVFYDVGANVGLTFVPIARNKAVRCFAFEPDPENFRLLGGNVAANSIPGTVLLNVAVADKRTKMGFARSAYNSGDHRLSSSGEVMVDCIALDELDVPTVPFAIKIDTQGAEPLIFEGAKKHMAAADLIICEYWPWGMARMGTKPNAVIDFVRAFPGRGLLARHDQPFDNFIPASLVAKQMETLAATAGEFEDADLVLIRD